jgi:hypothetical protein
LETVGVEVVGYQPAVFAQAAHHGDGHIARETDLHEVFVFDYFRSWDVVKPLFGNDIDTAIPEAEWGPHVQNVDYFLGLNPPNQLFS